MSGRDPICPFCGKDPYHYVDNGVGYERVAVTCCDLAIEAHSANCRPAVAAIGDRLSRLLESRALLEDIIDETRLAANDTPALTEAVARLEKAEAEVAETRKWVDEIVKERLDEINAEGEAFDKASANCLRNEGASHG